MPHIPNFRNRWDRYKRSADRIKPEHFANGITHDIVGKLIPYEVWQEFPARGLEDKDHITGAAFGMWITAKHGVPDEGKRVEHFEKATGVPISVWIDLDEEAFERAIRRAAKEALSWRELKQRITAGLRILKISTPPDPLPSVGIESRFIGAGERRYKDLEIVWPGCQARIEVPLARPPAERDDRRVWLLAEYPDAIYVLDPRPHLRERPVSQVKHGLWTPSGRSAEIGYITLPRGHPNYVWIDPNEKPGSEFDLFAIVINLSDEDESTIARFDKLERRLFDGKALDVLDEVATFLNHHEIPPAIYHRACRVERTATGEGGIG